VNPELLNQVTSAEKYFENTRYHRELTAVLDAFKREDEAELKVSLSKLPTYSELLKTLIRKLKGKSVYSTLKRLSTGNPRSKWDALKGLTSLATHACIECERGSTEYRLVLAHLYEKIGASLFSKE